MKDLFQDGAEIFCHSVCSIASITDVLFPEKVEMPKVDICYLSEFKYQYW